MSDFENIKKSAETVTAEFNNIDEQVKHANWQPSFFRKPPFCRAPFPCDEKQVRAIYNHNKLKVPLQFCAYNENCNQRVFDRREAVSQIGFAIP